METIDNFSMCTIISIVYSAFMFTFLEPITVVHYDDKKSVFLGGTRICNSIVPECNLLRIKSSRMYGSLLHISTAFLMLLRVKLMQHFTA